MLTRLSIKDFVGVPYLATSTLMKTHKNKLSFSRAKPNVLVGPNGSGKSALMRTLAIRFLAEYTGESCFDDNYVTSTESKDWWAKKYEWGDPLIWLQGLECESDNGPVLYYRPGHIPGNECDITHSLMMGYSQEANAYAKLVDKKSSGQQSQAVQARLLAALQGKKLPKQYGYANWRFGKEPRDLDKTRGWVGSYERQAEVLRSMYAPKKGDIPLILMDEPEQSLDARAEAHLWNHIASADCDKLQIIVATHSLYPLLHKDKFNLIETEPGFIKDVLSLLGDASK